MAAVIEEGCVMSIGEEEDDEAFFQRCYENLQRNFFNGERRPLLKGRKIKINLQYKIGNCYEVFWHIAGFSEEDLGKDSLPFRPCVNSPSTVRCEGNCINRFVWKELSSKERRYTCLYRASFCGLIPKVVSMANGNDPHVTYWEKEKDHKTRIYLRYQSGIIDYLVVFEAKSGNSVFFVTAFPIFFEREKMQCARDCFKYNK